MHLEPYHPWCAVCGWNVTPVDAVWAAPERGVDRWRRRRSERTRQSLAAEARSGDRGPGARRRLIAAYAVAALLHGALLAPLALGLVLWALVPSPGGPIAAAVCAAIALANYLAGIGWRRPPTLTRNIAPELFGIVDEIADRLDARHVRFVSLDDRLNASVRTIGIPRRTALVLGLPLFHALDGDARTFLLAHEISHTISGDCERSWFFGQAFRFLEQLYRAGNWLTSPHRRYHLLFGLDSLFLHLLAGLLRTIADHLARLLTALSSEESCRAELVADATAAHLSGSAAANRVFDAIGAGYLWPAAQRRAIKSSPMHAYRTLVRDMPETERARIAQSDGAARTVIDASHPPTVDRREALALLGAPPELVIAPERWQRVDDELAEAVEAIDRDVTNAIGARWRASTDDAELTASTRRR